MRKFITRGPKKGRCNICGDFGILTEDHTPPKGSARITQVELNTLTEILNSDKPTKGGRISKNGVKFRSLCKTCNNSYLGSNYDLAFIDFSQKIKKLITSNIHLPSVIKVRAKPQKIARALYGHLCAIGVESYFDSEQNNELKEWFLDETLAFPNCLNIYYWPYPYRKQILVRDAALRDLNVKDNALIWLMKFFPIAFLIVWDNPEGYEYPHLANFNKWRDITCDEEIEMPIYLRNIPREHWPETPEKNSFLGYNRDYAIGAVERKKKKKKS